MHSILAARTDFSVGESILTTEKLIDIVKDKGASAFAVTDTMSVTSMIDIAGRAKKAGIKPLIGTRLRLTDNPTWRPGDGEKKKDKPRSYYMTVYALTENGLKAIFRLLSKASSEDRFYYETQLGFDDLWEELARLAPDDLAVTMGDTNSALTHPDVDAIARELASFGLAHAYATLVPVDTPYFTACNLVAMRLIDTWGLKPLVVRPALYAEGEADHQEVMAAVSNGDKLTDPWFRSAYNRDFHPIDINGLKLTLSKAIRAVEAREPSAKRDHWMDGVRNTTRLVDATRYVWAKQPNSLPKMAPDEFGTVLEECKKGWAVRFAQPTFGHMPTAQELAEIYKPRLAYELSVLKRLEFSGYFLLVQDVVRFAKSNDILVGPGRGSVGGSLVAYLMGITDCDPIRFDLLFERFINPERIDLPDADLDFMSERRGEVIDYLVNKYGQARVAGVSNFGTLAAASTIRDVGKALGIPETEYSVSKFTPKLHGQNVPLPECRTVPEIDAFAVKYAPAWTVMERLEGTIRSFGTHAAGVIVGGVDLVERGVIERRKDGNVLCWDKRIVEDQGLIKMDVLGLRTLDLIALTLRYVRERGLKRVNLLRVPLDDERVLANFAIGNTTGIFQFESPGMRRLLKELGSDGTITFDDITAATALYRPGPMESGMMDSFYLRKQGLEAVEYDHPLMEPVLKETFGVIVYQEQVMKISQVIAGYSGAAADKLRKIMGKKLPEEMAKERGKFVDGCVKTIASSEEWAGALFDKIEGFAGYGFNKSHSVEYTLISYQSMWLKTYHPVEFFAAALTLMDSDKLTAILRDAALVGISVGVPDINISTDRFEIVTDTRLVIPFQAIKGVASTATKAILEARKVGPFKDKADFLARVEKRRCNIKVQTALDEVGAFARIEPSTPASDDPSRIRAQIELLPGLIAASMPISRVMPDKVEVEEFLNIAMNDLNKKHGLSGVVSVGATPVRPRYGKHAQFMLITDAPSSDEERITMMGSSLPILEAAEVHEFTLEDIYWTGLIKVGKSGKQVTPAEIAIYMPTLNKELEIIKPPIIVLMGTIAVRTFLPDFKGKASDEAGKIVYSKELDANLVIGFNPGELFYAPEKAANMADVFASVASLL